MLIRWMLRNVVRAEKNQGFGHKHNVMVPPTHRDL
jgi:hypothetical protein